MMEIQLKGITAKAVIGCSDVERSVKQSIVADVTIALADSLEHAEDDLTLTVDYVSLTEFIIAKMSATSYKLLESLARYLVDEILLEYRLINKVYLTLTKPELCSVRAKEIKVSYSKERRFKVALALGSNHQFLPQQQLVTALELLGSYLDGITVGGMYETLPVGFTKQANFYNTALTAYTSLTPIKLLAKIKKIEKLMGKSEVMPNGPRIIDIDLILFADWEYKYNFLIIPHAQAHLRDFVLKPLADIAPDWIYPGLNKTVQELLDGLPKAQQSILQKVEYYKNS